MKTAIIDGTFFTAAPVSFTFIEPEAPIFLTHVYSGATLTSLTAGEVIGYVHYP
jgi:hypothetical protein